MADYDDDYEYGPEGAGSPIKVKEKSGKRKSIEGKYQKLSHYEHVLKRPDTYIGSVEKTTEEMWVWDDEAKNMVFRKVTFVPGIFKIFDEILVNAADNKQRDPTKCNCIKIHIEPENNRIKVWNNGKGIEVTEHREHAMWVPELIFGELLTGANYDDEEQKVTGGRNGYGAKLCNIFSDRFVVETSCEKYKKCFKMEWKKNMKTKGTAKITPHKGSPFTRITFEPDLSKFGMQEGGLDKDIVSILTRRAYDIAATTGCKVFLNDEKINVTNFKDYCMLYLKDQTDQTGKPVTLVHQKINNNWEIGVAVSDNGFRQVSFCNSIATTKGGKHVEYVLKQVTNKIKEECTKGKKGRKVVDSMIRNHCWLFVNSLVVNPTFDSQTKENMTLPNSKYTEKCDVPDPFLKRALKCGITDAVKSFSDFKEQKKLDKTRGTKTNKINVPKLDDANNAGTKNALGCTLILTEGDSAKSTAVCGLGVIGRDDYGVFPLRGKVLNVRDATTAQISGNAEISNLVKILALDYKQKYEDRDELKRLRYGKVMVMTDQDHDGSHIKGLLINFFQAKWPNLLKYNFLEQFITPIVKVTHKKTKNTVAFYSMPEYEEWQAANPNAAKWHVKYYKGLGTSSNKEAKEYFQDIDKHRIKFKHSGDVSCDQAIELAFSKKEVDNRKKWLLEHMKVKKERLEAGEPEDYLYVKGTRSVTYKQFVDKELVHFSYADLARSVPNVMDGFKPGQRKVMYTFFNKYSGNKELKVAQASGGISEFAAYHHGEVSLQGTIVGMAQKFVGTNNINMLLPLGQFGSRLQGGKDAASARYIFTKVSKLARLLFPEVDDNLLTRCNDDGKLVEPEFYAPILPMSLINGSSGIGTGWASSIPNHSIKDVLENTRRLLQGEEAIDMIPSYRNFIGQITKIDENKYVCSGEIAALDEKSVEITELPVKTWTNNYKETVLDVLRDGKKDNKGNVKDVGLIQGYKEYSTESRVRFVVDFASAEKMRAAEQAGIHKFFSCQTTITCTNGLVAFDDKGCLQKYTSTKDMLKDWFNVRLVKFVERKQYLVEKYGAECKELSNKARFIKEICEDKLVIKKKSKKVIEKMLKEAKYDPSPVKRWRDSRLSVDQKREEREKAQEEEARLNDSQIDSDDAPAVDDKDDDNMDYDYLLSMQLWSLSKERMEKLLADKVQKEKALAEIKNTTPEQMWLNDLDAFEKAWVEDETKAEKERSKEVPMKGSKSKSKSRGAHDKLFKKSSKLGKKEEAKLMKECMPDEDAVRYEPRYEYLIPTKREKKPSGEKKEKKPKKEAKDPSKGTAKLENYGFTKMGAELENIKNEATGEPLKQEEIDEMLKKQPKKSALKSKSSPKAKKPPKKKAKRNEWETDSEEDNDAGDGSDPSDDDFEAPLPSRKVAGRGAKTAKKSYNVDSDSDSEQDSEPPRKKATSKPVLSDSGSEDEPKSTLKKSKPATKKSTFLELAKTPPKKTPPTKKASKPIVFDSESEEEIAPKKKAAPPAKKAVPKKAPAKKAIVLSDSDDDFEAAPKKKSSSSAKKSTSAKKAPAKKKAAVSSSEEEQAASSSDGDSESDDMQFKSNNPSPIVAPRGGRGTGRARKPVKYVASQDSDESDDYSEPTSEDDDDTTFNMVD